MMYSIYINYVKFIKLLEAYATTHAKMSLLWK